MADRRDSSRVPRSLQWAGRIGLLCTATWFGAGCSQPRLVPVTPTSGSHARAEGQGISVIVDSESQNRPVREAVNGGSIATGNTLSGLVYFDEVPIRSGGLRLRIGVRSAAANAAPSVLEILYAVHG
jgi:hypothetical protein